MKLIRYPDLVAKGVVKSRMTLKRLIDDRGFPPGVLITPNARAWDEAEVDEWVKRRPAARKQWVRKFPDRHDPAGPHQKDSPLEEGDDDAQSKHRARRPRVIVDRSPSDITRPVWPSATTCIRPASSIRVPAWRTSGPPRVGRP